MFLVGMSRTYEKGPSLSLAFFVRTTRTYEKGGLMFTRVFIFNFTSSHTVTRAPKVLLTAAFLPNLRGY